MADIMQVHALCTQWTQEQAPQISLEEDRND
jgi:hypothetical protein